MSTFVFLGPTLTHADAARLLPASYLPPARQGDVLRVLARGARRIGIVDGYFNHVPSIWHKEILVALERGVSVYGAASMGALRAAELHSFGMVGVGQVFEWYRDGTLTDDDEVAVAHGPAEQNYAAQSEALVNLREAVSAALSEGILEAKLGEALVALGKGLFFRERSYPNLFRIAREQGLASGTLSDFSRFVHDREPLKRRDARQLLERMASEAGRVHETPRRAPLERTVFLQRLQHQIELELCAEGASPEFAATAPDGEIPHIVRKKTLLRVLAMKHASDLGSSASDEETQLMADDFRRARGLGSPERMTAWLAEHGLTLVRFSQAMQELATVRKLEQRYAFEIDERVADHVRLGLGGRD